MAAELLLPKIGMAMTEGVVARWLKEPGERVEKGTPVVEVETDKITFEVEAAEDGFLHPLIEAGTLVPCETVIGYLLKEGEEAPPPPEVAVPQKEAVAKVSSVPAVATGGPIRATPAARRVASEMGVELREVRGSGPGGRIVEEDVRRYAQQAPAPSIPAGEVVPLTGTRKIIAQRMTQSLRESAQYTLTLEVDVTRILELRRQWSTGPEKIKISESALLVKAVAEALKKHPRLNAAIVNDEIHLSTEIHVGLAVALKEGLVVPVVRNADKSSLIEVSQTVNELTEKARTNRLSLDEIKGSTFTISILNRIDLFTPIINSPESAILGVGRIEEKPVVYKGQITPRSMMNLSLTVDHRLIDGAPAASFLHHLKQILELPDRLFERRG